MRATSSLAFPGICGGLPLAILLNYRSMWGTENPAIGLRSGPKFEGFPEAPMLPTAQAPRSGQRTGTFIVRRFQAKTTLIFLLRLSQTLGALMVGTTTRRPLPLTRMMPRSGVWVFIGCHAALEGRSEACNIFQQFDHMC